MNQTLNIELEISLSEDTINYIANHSIEEIENRLEDNDKDVLHKEFEDAGMIIDHHSRKTLLFLATIQEARKIDFESLGEWRHERSSGYSGYRCNVCATWCYANKINICNCDKHRPIYKELTKDA